MPSGMVFEARMSTTASLTAFLSPPASPLKSLPPPRVATAEMSAPVAWNAPPRLKPKSRTAALASENTFLTFADHVESSASAALSVALVASSVLTRKSSSPLMPGWRAFARSTPPRAPKILIAACARSVGSSIEAICLIRSPRLWPGLRFLTAVLRARVWFVASRPDALNRLMRAMPSSTLRFSARSWAAFALGACSLPSIVPPHFCQPTRILSWSPGTASAVRLHLSRMSSNDVTAVTGSWRVTRANRANRAVRLSAAGPTAPMSRRTRTAMSVTCSSDMRSVPAALLIAFAAAKASSAPAPVSAVIRAWTSCSCSAPFAASPKATVATAPNALTPSLLSELLIRAPSVFSALAPDRPPAVGVERVVRRAAGLLPGARPGLVDLLDQVGLEPGVIGKDPEQQIAYSHATPLPLPPLTSRRRGHAELRPAQRQLVDRGIELGTAQPSAVARRECDRGGDAGAPARVLLRVVREDRADPDRFDPPFVVVARVPLDALLGAVEVGDELLVGDAIELSRSPAIG